jgi:hypothetical protein
VLGVPHKSNFNLFFIFIFFAMSQFDWPITKKKEKVETMEAPQDRRFYEKMEWLPL